MQAHAPFTLGCWKKKASWQYIYKDTHARNTQKKNILNPTVLLLLLLYLMNS
jgi:hypothetical protein